MFANFRFFMMAINVDTYKNREHILKFINYLDKMSGKKNCSNYI